MNAAQVRAKARMAVKRREEEVEQEEMEGGELNLVPYLDIVTNILLFLLASIASGLILGHINSSLPEYSKGGGGGGASGERQMTLVLSITKDKMELFDQAEVDTTVKGHLANPFASLPETKQGPEFEFDYPALAKAAVQIVQDKFKGRYPLSVGEDKKTPVCRDDKKKDYGLEECRPAGATKVIILAEGGVPYYVIVAAMDAVRASTELGADGTPKHAWPDSVLFPDVIFATIN